MFEVQAEPMSKLKSSLILAGILSVYMASLCAAIKLEEGWWWWPGWAPPLYLLIAVFWIYLLVVFLRFDDYRRNK